MAETKLDDEWVTRRGLHLMGAYFVGSVLGAEYIHRRLLRRYFTAAIADVREIDLYLFWQPTADRLKLGYPHHDLDNGLDYITIDGDRTRVPVAFRELVACNINAGVLYLEIRYDG